MDYLLSETYFKKEERREKNLVIKKCVKLDKKYADKDATSDKDKNKNVII